MRCELSDLEWAVIKPMLPNKLRGAPRVNDRRVLNGIFWGLRSGAAWRDLPESHRPPPDLPQPVCSLATVRRLGPDHRSADSRSRYGLADDRYIHRASAPARGLHCGEQGTADGCSRGGLTSKAHAVADANGLPVRLGLSPGEAHDNRLCPALLAGFHPKAMVPADRGYDADWIKALVNEQGAWANIPPKRNRKDPICFSPYLYRSRNLVERFYNKIKQCRLIVTRYDKVASRCLALIKLASIRIWLRGYESMP